MPFQVEAAAKRTVHLKPKWGNQPVKIEYHAGERFRELEKEAQAEAEKAQKAFKKRQKELQKEREQAEDEGREYVEPVDEEEDFRPDEARRDTCKFLADILASWDVTIGGEMVPLETQTLFDLPLETAFFMHLRNAIMTDIQKGGAGGKASS